MPKYECDICSFVTNFKGNYKKHILSVKHVNNNLKSEDKYHKVSQNLSQLSHLSQNRTNYSKHQFKCEDCGQEFAQKNNLYRHRKHYCKGVEGQLIPKEASKVKTSSTNPNHGEQWEKDIDNLLAVSNTTNTLTNSKNTTNSTNNSTNNMHSHNTNYNHSNNVNSNNTNSNNNVQQNIVLNNFGKDSWDHVSDKEKIELLKKPYDMIKKAFEKVNLNKDVPENRNIRVENQRSGKVLVWEDEMWRNEDKTGTLKEVVGEKYYILDSFFRDLLEKDPQRLHQLMTKDEIRAYTKFSAIFDEETNEYNVNDPEKQPLGDKFAEACFYSLVDELINAKMEQKKANKEKETKLEMRREERRKRKQLNQQ